MVIYLRHIALLRTEMMYANHPKWCLRHNRHSMNASDLPSFMFLRVPLPILYAVSNENMKLICFNMYVATTYLLPTASKLCSNWAVCKYWQLCWIIPFPSPDPLRSAGALGGWHLRTGLTDFHAGNGGLNKQTNRWWREKRVNWSFYPPDFLPVEISRLLADNRLLYLPPILSPSPPFRPRSVHGTLTFTLLVHLQYYSKIL